MEQTTTWHTDGRCSLSVRPLLCPFWTSWWMHNTACLPFLYHQMLCCRNFGVDGQGTSLNALPSPVYHLCGLSYSTSVDGRESGSARKGRFETESGSGGGDARERKKARGSSRQRGPPECSQVIEVFIWIYRTCVLKTQLYRLTPHSYTHTHTHTHTHAHTHTVSRHWQCKSSSS